MRYFKGDISAVEADAIVNASNGIGYMGGWASRYIKVKGVAESLQYQTKGMVEKEAKRIIREHKYKPGDVFVTGAFSLKAEFVFHAITMKYPGTFSRLATIEKCLRNLNKVITEHDVKSIAIPGLGTGTGRLDKTKVARLFVQYLANLDNCEVIVVDPSGRFWRAVQAEMTVNQ